MSSGFPPLPSQGTMRLGRASVPVSLLDSGAWRTDADGLALVDLEITGGMITEVSESREALAAGTVDLDRGQVWPTFVDVHTHLDKGHILPRAGNPDGTVHGAVQSVAADRRANWSAEDVRRRFEFGLRCAFAHGTSAMRTHLDCDPPQAAISFPVFAALREKWSGKIALQAVGKLPLDLYLTRDGENFAKLVAEHGGLLGGVTSIFGNALDTSVEEALDALFRLAQLHNLDVDLHVDETGDPAATTLGQVARATIRHGYHGRVVCGHCCSLAVQPPDVMEKTLDLCAEAKLAVVTLPMINMYLQDRSKGQTPKWRGVTRLHELSAREIPVAIASDNCRDPFFAFGDHDMLEVYTQAVRIAHLDKPYGQWPRSVTTIPAGLMGLRSSGFIARGSPADLVLFRARTMSELLSRPQSDRVVLRAGRLIDTALPDYRELDDLLTPNSDPHETRRIPIRHSQHFPHG